MQIDNPKNGGKGEQVVEIKVPDAFTGWKLKNATSEWVKNGSSQDVLLAAVSVTPGSTQQLTLVPADTLSVLSEQDRAHAELSVRTGGQWEGKAYQAEGFTFEEVPTFTSPAQLTDHSYYLRYEGPGWESDKMGYRLYLDWRNAIDVFVKTNDAVALPQVGQDGYDSYHVLSEWGGDALKVGKSLGVGALGRQTEAGVLHFQYVDNTQYNLLSNTLLRAEFEVKYQGWATDESHADAVDVTTHYRIDAFDPTTHIHVDLSEAKDNIVTGLVAHNGMDVINATEGQWGVVATWGAQSILADGDVLGLAVFYRLDQVSDVTQGEHDHLVAFKPATSLDYKILAVWPQRDEEVQTAEAFERYLVNKLKTFNYPITVRQ
ncbi:DUF4861 family protein [Alteromonas sp. D210916BOD_24]|uniref:DUF4861 family protein n=1 Tax=Alteromonas sp. D210916BOD_24 TaxID=3157618 RepID=UPI00399CD880